MIIPGNRGEGRQECRTMGNSGVEQSLAGKVKPAPPAGQEEEEEERRVLEEKLYCTRLELQKTRAVSADADETISRLAAAARRMAQERDEAWNQRNALLAELHARRNAQMMMALAAGAGPHRSFASYSGRAGLFAPAAAAPFGGRMPTPLQQMYARAAGVSYCFASSSSSSVAGNGLFFHNFASSSQQDSFDPDMFLVDPAESPPDSVSAATAGSAPGLQQAGKKSGSELDLVAEQMLMPRKKGKVAEAVRDDDEGSPSVEAAVDAGATEEDAGGSLDKKCSGGGGGCSLADVVNSAGKKRTDSS